MSKNNIDWSKAPSDATHYKGQFFYKLKDGVWMYYEGEGLGWNESSNNAVWFKSVVSKEEDLEMNKEVVKQVSCIEDLEVGMFFKSKNFGRNIIIKKKHGKVEGRDLDTNLDSEYSAWGFHDIESWSYTYSGEYTPIVKETEAERKIKELESTIELAQKQLQEYKEMK